MTQAVVDAAFQALVQDEKGSWYLTDNGLRALEGRLRESVADGTLAACAFEMRGLMGFLTQEGRADRALQQMRALSAKFAPALEALGAKLHVGRRIRAEQASALLGGRTEKRARAYDAPKEGLSLSDIAPQEMLRDPRTFGPREGRSPSSGAATRTSSGPNAKRSERIGRRASLRGVER